MGKNEAIKFAQEETNYLCKLPGNKAGMLLVVADIILSEHPMEVKIVYAGGQSATWSGLYATTIRRLMAELPSFDT